MKILIVETDPESARLVEGLLSEAGHQIRVASTCADSLDVIESGWPDIVLLEVNLPDGDGFSLCRELKSRPETQPLPVAFVSRRGDERSVVQGLGSGALDYVAKPFRSGELVARVGVLCRVKQAEDEARRLSYRDPLTGLYNRRFLTERLLEEISRAQRYGHALSCLLIDIDRFKGINDRHGHPFGDRALVAVSDMLLDVLRTSDVVVRMGGDEFMIVLPHTPLAGAAVAGERIMERAQNVTVENGDVSAGLTLSIGVADFRSHRRRPDEEADLLLDQVDRCLYEAKREGRNRVVTLAADSSTVPESHDPQEQAVAGGGGRLLPVMDGQDVN